MFRIISLGESLKWETIKTREEIEKYLLQRNKSHLQQVSKEYRVPMQAWFQTLIRCDGYYEEGGRILEGDIEWNKVPDDPEVRAWLKAVV